MLAETAKTEESKWFDRQTNPINDISRFTYKTITRFFGQTHRHTLVAKIQNTFYFAFEKLFSKIFLFSRRAFLKERINWMVVKTSEWNPTKTSSR